MESRSLADQEKDIKELLRRVERTPIKNSNSRKEVLKRLIDLAHSPHASLKIIAATSFKNFVKDFPDLEDDAINAVYDLCEDQSSQVRIKGYNAIVEVSQVQPKWVKRNADVLVQLLQSDEPEEVTFVKRALTQHLDMDPAVTLGVLCDQIVPPDEPMDEEEQAIRDKLRSLVLAFITIDAKRAIVERHTASPGSAAEEVLANGMFKALSKLTVPDVKLIIDGLLLSLSSFKPYSQRATELLNVVLERAKEALKYDLPPGSEQSSLDFSRGFLDLASEVAIEKHLASPSPLLRLYHQQLMPKMTIIRLTGDARIYVISNVAKTLAALEETSTAEEAPSSEDLQLRKFSPDMSVALLQLFSEPSLGDSRPWDACRILLDVCVRRKKDSNWTVPSHLATTLRSIESLLEAARAEGKGDSLEEIQNLIRPLLPPADKASPVPPPSPTPSSDVAKGMTASNNPPRNNPPRNERRIMNVKRKPTNTQPIPLPPRPQVNTMMSSPILPHTGSSNGMRTSTARQNLPYARQRTTTTSLTGSASNGLQHPGDRNSHPSPRARNGSAAADHVSNTPSLLSRLASTSSNGSATSHRGTPPLIPAKRARTESAPVISRSWPSPDLDAIPAGGFSIRGAASRKNMEEDDRPARPSSLLDRMQGDEDGFDAGGRKRKKKQKT